MAATKGKRRANRAGVERTTRRIFISHSFTDHWVADHIRKDLLEHGVDSFLAEKDVETGAEVVPVISNELRACDEFLVILSPASVKSEWVSAEIGAAMGLQKPIASILLHVGPNVVPRILVSYLARDINDIGRYYSEVKQRSDKPAKPRRNSQKRAPKQSAKAVRKRRIGVGDTVRIVDAPQADVYRGTKMINWVPEFMDRHSRQIASVIEVDRDGSARLDIDNGTFWWAFEWLTRMRR